LRWIELLCRYGERYNNIWRGGGKKVKKEGKKKIKRNKKQKYENNSK
jgi:hypothetical protein